MVFQPRASDMGRGSAAHQQILLLVAFICEFPGGFYKELFGSQDSDIVMISPIFLICDVCTRFYLRIVDNLFYPHGAPNN